MLEIPDLTNLDAVFGNIGHMPKYDELPDDFRDYHHNLFGKAVSSWFFNGASRNAENFVIDGVTFTPKEGVDGPKALTAIRAVLSSFEPKHEHKIAGCAFMLSEWFDKNDAETKGDS